jgi:hypothetical protein
MAHSYKKCPIEKNLIPITGAPVSSTNKTDHRDITKILLKVALNTINQTKPMSGTITTTSS